MEKKLLEAYVDGFEMAKEIFIGNNNVFGLYKIMKASALTAKHASKMAEYANMDASNGNMSNEGINQSLLADCEKLREMVADYEKRIEAAKNAIYEWSKTIDDQAKSKVDITDFIESLTDFHTIKGKYKNEFSCTKGKTTVTGVSILECYNKLKRFNLLR